MPPYTIVTAQDRERFLSLNREMPRASGPAFLEHDRAVLTYWPRLVDAFPADQFCLFDPESSRAAAVGRSIPVAFEGDWAGLPDGGLDWVLEKGFEDLAARRMPTIMSALYIEVAETHRGRHVSAHALDVLRAIARSHGFRHLLAPVRPSQKSRYPLIPMEEYMRWQIPDGLPFDPWLRVHVRAGARILHACPRAMVMEGTRPEWSSWTGMEFPGDGDHIIPGGLVPLTIRGDRGEYVEPGIWVLHELGARAV